MTSQPDPEHLKEFPSRLRLIVGMSRAGTTALAQTLNLHPKVVAFGETLFWGNLWIEPDDGMYNRAELDEVLKVYKRGKSRTRAPGRSGTGALEDVDINRAVLDTIEKISVPVAPVDVFRAIGNAVADLSGVSYWVEKTPHHLMHLDRIMASAVDTKVVVNLRKPEDFLLSYKYQGGQLAPGVRQNFRRTYHPLAASLVCRGYLREALAASNRYPDSVRLVWLEDLSRDEGALVADVLKHLDLPLAPNLRIVSVNSSFEQTSERPILASEDRIWLKILAGGVAKKMGLETVDAPFAPFALVTSLISLPVWAFRVFATQKRTGYSFLRLLKRWLR